MEDRIIRMLTLAFLAWAYRNSWTLDAGLWTLDSGRWTLDAELWTLDSGHCR